MPNIEIKVAGKIATNTTPDVVLVCGNSDYTVTLDLDEEWAAEPIRTVRFSYIRDGKKLHKEHTIKGNTVAVPMLSGVRQVAVGLYAGDLRTTTPAVIWCKLSILCGDSVEEITKEEKAGIQSQLDRLTLGQITPEEKAEVEATLADFADRLAELEYTPMDVLSASNTIGTKELGTVVEAATVSWTVNKAPTSQTLNGENVAADARSAAVGPVSKTTKFTVRATDERGAADEASTTAYFYNGVYYGAMAPGAAIDSPAILALARKFQSGRAVNFSAGGNGKRPVYAAPTRYGVPTFVIGGFTYAWDKVASIDFTNAAGYTELYDVWMHGKDVAEPIPVAVS